MVHPWRTGEPSCRPASCNQCHVSLQVHGTLRNNTEYCVLLTIRPIRMHQLAQGAASLPKVAPPQGINFNLLVHRIHYGINMEASKRTYIIVGFRGSHNDFSDTLFPAMDGEADGYEGNLFVPRQR